VADVHNVKYATPGALISDCGTWRWKLWRPVMPSGIVVAFFGVNPSTAGPVAEDFTTRKWKGFAARIGARAYLAGNPFAYRATNVREIGAALDPVGPENSHHLSDIILAADILVPCWGNRSKVPRFLRHHLDGLQQRLFASGKPVHVFGLTASGDPMHPLMLSYDTQLVRWTP
jgi:hypothetical protein